MLKLPSQKLMNKNLDRVVSSSFRKVCYKRGQKEECDVQQCTYGQATPKDGIIIFVRNFPLVD